MPGLAAAQPGREGPKAAVAPDTRQSSRASIRAESAVWGGKMCVHVVIRPSIAQCFTRQYTVASRGFRCTWSSSRRSRPLCRALPARIALAEREVHYAVGATRAGVERYWNRLSAAEALVLYFPTWWYGMPASKDGSIESGCPVLPSTIHLRAARSGVVLPVSASSRLRPNTMRLGGSCFFTVGPR